MFFRGKVKRILNEKTGEEAIMAIDDLLSLIFYSDPEALSAEEKTIVYIEALEREVNNGGFSQFFYNPSGDYSEETVMALRDVGSTVFLRLLTSAIGQFPDSHVPSNQAERHKILARIEETAGPTWNKLDQEFYRYEEDLYGLMRDYISTNIKKFR